MIAWAAGLWMGVGRFSKPLREVEVTKMLDAGPDTPPRIEVTLGAGVL